ncbi:MAG: hypothetical protein FJ056_10370 [Cyanobacteria bacterium M_surface_10_m2_179]|nr:hypothetical protein [Cyanobacteria bacterium M_surface_10_m2_179]
MIWGDIHSLQAVKGSMGPVWLCSRWCIEVGADLNLAAHRAGRRDRLGVRLLHHAQQVGELRDVLMDVHRLHRCLFDAARVLVHE